MTGPSDERDDAAWLEALAGRAGDQPDSAAVRQAAALRRVLEQRRERLDREVPVASEALFQRIADEVHADQRRERLDREVPVASEALFQRIADEVHADQLDDKFSIADDTDVQPRPVEPHVGRQRWRNPWAWGIAASMVVATVVTIQMWPGKQHEDDGPVLRGADVAVQVVPDPGSSAAELDALLKAAGAIPRVERVSDGSVMIYVEATPAVLDALASRRLMPQPKDGKIVIRLERTAAGKP